MSKEIYNRIVIKLQKLDEYLGYLNDVQKVNKREFLADYHFFGLAERYLQLSIEILLDVGKMIIVSESLTRPEENQDVFVVLHDKNILSEELTNNLIGVANFRNILVHEYEGIDREIVWTKRQKKYLEFFQTYFWFNSTIFWNNRCLCFGY